MSKKILTVGFELASGAVEEQFNSKISLLDWDVVLFRPTIDDLFEQNDDPFQGKPSLTSASSFQLKESCEHWRREIKQAVEHGKTVIVFLPALNEVYVDTGRRTYSGTGKNQRTTRQVDLYSNYEALPLQLKPVNTSGSSMKLVHLGAELLAPLWAEFGSRFEYKVLISSEIHDVCLTTKVGDKPVGAIVRTNNSSGALVLLPDIDTSPDDFLEEDGDGDLAWTTKAAQFARKITSAVVALDKALKSLSEITPEPSWAIEPKYALAREQSLRSELLEAEELVSVAQKRKEAIMERLKGAGSLRALLYEKGKPLEHAIIAALSLLGFAASPYKQGSSEFDVVFQAAEGRLLGEAEGKDTKAVNVDKLRQLMMNIQEDLQREEVNSPAKGVLFGNGYRLAAPADRETQFTEKCLTAAQSSNTALIATSDLYVAAQYLSDRPDEGYSKLCRVAILAGAGLVQLPHPPAGSETESAN